MTIYPVHLKQTAHSVKYRIETTRKSKEEEDEKQMKKQLSLQERAHKFSPKTAIGYALQDGTNTLGALLVSYVTYFATDSLFLSATSIGMVLAFSRVFDGITDLIAGALIDKTKTRWGKARPFVLVGFLYWISLLAIFATPASLSDIGKLVWIMITYNLNGAVFNTLIGTAKPVLLRRTTIDDNARIKTLTMTSLLMNVAAVVVSVILPLIIAKNNTPQGWLMMGVVFAVIGCISTAITFFCCVEYTEEELVELGIIDQNAVNKDKLSLKDSFYAIVKNKYLLIYIVQYIIIMLAMGMFNGAGTYYYSTNLGDLTLMSTVSLVSILSYPLFLVYPKIIEKIGAIRFTRYTLLIGGIGFLALSFVGDNLILLCVTSFLAGFLLVGVNVVGNEIIIQCMDYSYLKNGIRAEGIYSALAGFSYKVAMGVSSAIMGIILGLAHYDGALAVQPESAHIAINAMFNLFPAAVGIIIFFTFKSVKVKEANEKLRAEMLAREAAENK